MGKRVLVAEDNDMNFALVKFVLGKAGVDVERATTGNDALDSALTNPPELILMDVQLPGIDGLEVTRRLRAQPSTQDVPIVAVTALAMVGDEERAKAAGCNDYLTKPVSPHTLLATLARFVPPGAPAA